MPEKIYEELFYQLERCNFALTTMLKDVGDITDKLSHAYCYGDAYTDWPEDADIMLEEMANAIGEADDKVYKIVTQIRQYID